MRIGVDLDGVIVDSIQYWIRVLNRESGTNYRSGDLPDTYSTAELAAFIAGLQYEQIPAAIRERVKDIILDSLASALAGTAVSASTMRG